MTKVVPMMLRGLDGKLYLVFKDEAAREEWTRLNPEYSNHRVACFGQYDNAIQLS